MRILIVDDSRVMRQLIQRSLRQAGYGHCELIEAADGEAALAAVPREDPDLVLSDSDMPRMGGLELLRVLRSRGDTRAFGLLVTEGSATVRETALRAGAQFVLTKPFTSEDFRAALRPAPEPEPEPEQPTVRASWLPDAKSVRDLLGVLLNRQVEVAAGDAWAPEPADLAVLAEFVDDRLRLRALAVLDLPLAMYAGAAIGLLPPGGADDMIDARSPGAMVLENLREVLTVLASVFAVPDAGHVKMWMMRPPGTPLPADVDAACRRQVGRLDLEVTIDGYGGGRLALILTTA